VETAVIGAGQAGLAMSWWLKQAGREHVVLEARDRLGGSWLKRWDSFCLVTPNWSVRPPGLPYDGNDPDGYMPRDALVAYMDRYSRSFDAPVAFGARVIRLVLGGADHRLDLETERGNLTARNVVVATGPFQVPRVPAAAGGLLAGVVQLHTDAYRNEADLPPGAVLVVGTGQSGAQIAEELLHAGRRVFLSVSSSWRAPRRYRGRDTFFWLAQLATRGPDLGFPAETVDDLPDPRMRFAANPHLSGKDGGHDINLRRLGADGVTLLGRVKAAANGRVELAPDLETNLHRADTFFDEHLRPDLDRFIELAGFEAPPGEFAQVAFDPPAIGELDLAAEGISSVIWATGFRFDFGWIPDLELDAMGYPRHRRGKTPIPGLYLLGLPWLHTQASSLLVGVGNDAEYLAHDISG
jgi:putative flavoprotein involved in K+ transport